jgi:uncharacterized membrane protein
MSETALPSGDPHAAPRFSAILRPHRSLSRTGFIILMSFVGFVSFVAGVGFLSIGAWPVFGFFGLDAGLVWLAFHLNYRQARAYETVQIFERKLVLTQVSATGQVRRHELNPYWARVEVKSYPNGRTDLRLVSHGRIHSFGRFLTDEERRGFSDTLSDALAAARR